MKSKYISINKKVQFGDPCIKGTRINVWVIHDFYLGGEKIKSIAGMYNLNVKQVRAAIRFYKTYYINGK